MDTRLKPNQKTHKLSKRYRPDIDGLRAVAVISVLLFHAGFSIFSGGFAGVDVFFVISGFLITRLIIDEIDAGSFSFSNFYIRRVRRLFPALFVVVSATLVAGYIIFPPEYLQRFSGAVIYALASLSNFYFLSEFSYFDAASELKPLLHTWSLSVEEQFYLFWPALLVLLASKFPRWVIPAALLIAGGISLALADIFSNVNSLFFFTGFRIFELAIGGLMVWVCKIEINTNWIKEILLSVGLAMILWSFFMFNENTPWPSLYTLVPCLGAALVIYAGTAKYMSKVLSNPVSVFFGLISYSLYLVHWPLIVFYSFTKLAPITQTEKMSLVIVSIALAWGLYKIVEVPFRHGHTKPGGWAPAKFGLASAMLAMALIIPASHMYANDGWRFRIKHIDIEKFTHDNNYMEYRSQANFDEFSANPLPVKTAQTNNILVVGDSHSLDFFNAMNLNASMMKNANVAVQRFDDLCFLNPAKPNLRDRLMNRGSVCQLERDELLQSGKLARADIVIVANRWALRYMDGVENGFEFLADNTDAKIISLGANSEFPYLLKEAYKIGVTPELNTNAYKTQLPKYIGIDDILIRIAKAGGHTFIARNDIVCDNEAKSCKVVSDNGKLMYFDDTHWSWEGEVLFGSKIIATAAFQSLLKNNDENPENLTPEKEIPISQLLRKSASYEPKQ